MYRNFWRYVQALDKCTLNVLSSQNIIIIICSAGYSFFPFTDS